ncbi:hypothetical protein B0I33_110214 [Prauserella shujinwangii]|uniref:Uncharacterized protein n=1 Tax=Prauserella shujinwangii TaxID=1453103 RepID=A0A2T0LPF4_9PSEU|nr:hypothetical protein [Prauserella shujinwangii]PRX45115.1 hypothetical protein B0I33_110214 [Prauserella shujinwangii]
MPDTVTSQPRIFAYPAAAGMVIAVTGTFLPWFRSGEVLRDSYAAAALAHRFGIAGEPISGALARAWIGVPMLGALCAGLLVLGVFRTAAAATATLAVIVGTVAVAALVEAGGGVTGTTVSGPLVTTTGMTLALLGALGVLGTIRRGGRAVRRTGRAGVRP